MSPRIAASRLARRAVLLGPTILAIGATAAAAPIVAAASDLKFALEEIARLYAKRGGGELRLVFGSSGQLATQIAQGAPFELFLSADESMITRLLAQGRVRDSGQLYAIGRIVLFAPAHSAMTVDPALDGLAAALDAGTIRRFAIANPEHAPYGRAAEQALRHRGLWSRLEPKLVLGENVSQAAQFAASGSTQGGIIALSIAGAPSFAGLGRSATIAAAWHAPLQQRMALVTGASPAAAAFYAFLAGSEARAVFDQFGFTLPPATG